MTHCAVWDDCSYFSAESAGKGQSFILPCDCSHDRCVTSFEHTRGSSKDTDLHRGKDFAVSPCGFLRRFTRHRFAPFGNEKMLGAVCFRSRRHCSHLWIAGDFFIKKIDEKFIRNPDGNYPLPCSNAPPSLDCALWADIVTFAVFGLSSLRPMNTQTAGRAIVWHVCIIS
jgi:hypothetical protein